MIPLDHKLIISVVLRGKLNHIVYKRPCSPSLLVRILGRLDNFVVESKAEDEFGVFPSEDLVVGLNFHDTTSRGYHVAVRPSGTQPSNTKLIFSR